MGIRNFFNRLLGKENLTLRGVQCPACWGYKTYYVYGSSACLDDKVYHVSGNSAVYSVWHCVNCNRDFEVRYGSRYRTEI